MKGTTIAVDLAKSVFEVAVSREAGKVISRHRLSRKQFGKFFANRRPATVLMEACGSSHYWGREIGRQGHNVVLLPPQYVRPYVRRDKTDRADAKGLLEAYRNEEIRPVPVKSTEQQALMMLHRARSAWVGARTARINLVRGVLRELGVVIPQGASRVLPALHSVLGEPEGVIPGMVRPVVASLAEEIEELTVRIRSLEKTLKQVAGEIPSVAQLQTIPGIGLLTATALVAMVGDIHRFRSGRHFAGYLGLTPREYSTGGTRRLGKISKRGDAYLRTLLIHGARAVLRWGRRKTEVTGLERQGLRIEKRRGHNRAVVAVANRMARVVWAVWSKDQVYSPQR
jgi:transposase